MKRVLTGHDIRLIDRILNDAGINCLAKAGTNNDVTLNLAWKGYFSDGRLSGMDYACRTVWSVVKEAIIEFLGGNEMNGVCEASLHVTV